MPRKHKDFSICHSAALKCHPGVIACLFMPNIKKICLLVEKDGTNGYQANKEQKQLKDHR